jgi:hypothetical protein
MKIFEKSEWMVVDVLKKTLLTHYRKKDWREDLTHTYSFTLYAFSSGKIWSNSPQMINTS